MDNNGIIEEVLEKLAKSNFRNRFHLTEKEFRYIEEKGLDTIEEHAREFVQKRLAPAVILNDGKQTPMRGHPVFISQHATATCCRGCLWKRHKIQPGILLNEERQEYIVKVIMMWINKQIQNKD